MSNIKIIITNCFFPTLTETFITRVDMSDLNEVEMAIDECCGQFLDMHNDIINAKLSDLDLETIAEEFCYIVEEVV